MQVASEQEALYVACEMESTAVQLYTRALALMEQMGREKEPLYERVQQMCRDEQMHLYRFRSLYTGLEAEQEQQLSLAAVGEGLLFEGGLMGAVRAGLLKDTQSMLDIAAQSERASARKYREFAEQAQTEEARRTLKMIALEEDSHLRDLEEDVRRGSF